MRGFDEDDFREVGADHLRGARRERRRTSAALWRAATAQTLCDDSGLAAYPGFHGLHDLTSAVSMAARARAPRAVTVVDAPARPAQALVPARQGRRRPSTSASSRTRSRCCSTYEATKDLPTEAVEIETPLERMTAQRISGKKVAVCPVLRAGLGMLDGVLSLVSSARVGFIGLYRDEETLAAGRVLREAPELGDGERDAIVLDPMLATGNSSAAAIAAVKEAGARSVTLVCLVAAPEGIEHLQPSTRTSASSRAAVDRGLERARLHRPGPRRRRRPALRDEVGADLAAPTIEAARALPVRPSDARSWIATSGLAGGAPLPCLADAHRPPGGACGPSSRRDRRAPDARGRRNGAPPRSRRRPGAGASTAAPSRASAGSRSSSAIFVPALAFLPLARRDARPAARRGRRDDRRRDRRLPRPHLVGEARRPDRGGGDPDGLRHLGRPLHVPGARRARAARVGRHRR